MELKQMQELIKNTSTQRAIFFNSYESALKYYRNETDITSRNDGKAKLNKDGKDDPLRHADNRVPSNFYQLLVDQEAGYVATVPPQIDVGNEKYNEDISEVLGDDFALTVNNLVIDASNAGVAWLHYWIDQDNNFRYAIIPPNQITPIYSTALDNKLLGVLRSYKQLDPDTGKLFTVHEYWNDKEATFFKQPTSNLDDLEPYNNITSYDMSAGYETGVSNVLKHNFERVPFIAFPKNKLKLSELKKCKGLIDAYDDIYNGFLNDIDDIQQVVLVLKNYGGTSLDKFMHDLKENKAVKFNNAGNGDQSGIDTLQIDIPVEARNSVLQTTKENIFLYGQGIDPANFKNSNASGVAIKMLYSHLELKAGITESNFRRGISQLVRAIMNHLGIRDADSLKISQIWTRTQVQDDLAKAQEVATVANYSSKEAIAKSNPIVDDWQQELKYQKEDIQNSDGFRASQSFNDSEDEDYSNDNKNDSDKSEKANKKSSD